MKNQQQLILGSRRVGEKRLKRECMLQRRIVCHGNKENCTGHLKKEQPKKDVYIPKEEKVIIPVQTLKVVKKSWIALLKEKVLIILRSTIASIFKGRNKE